MADLNRLAARIVKDSTDPNSKKPESAHESNRRKGGLKGGKARATALTPERRREIARTAAQTRWARKAQG